MTKRNPFTHLTPRHGFALLAIALLFLPGVFAHEPVFGGGAGLRAAAVGVAIGLGVTALAHVFRWQWWTTVGVLVVAYLVFGGWAAVPASTTNGFLPTAQTWQLLVLQPVHSWMDLLTLMPPAAAFTGPAVLPYFAGVVLAGLAGAATFSGRWLLGTLPPALFALIGAAWSVPHAPHAMWWALGFGAVSLVWWAINTHWDRVSRGEDIVIGRRARKAQREEGDVANTDSSGALLTVTETRTETRTSWGRRTVATNVWLRILGALGTIGVGVLIAALVVPAWSAGQPRTVLRDYVSPPLEVQELATPLQNFRHLNADLEEEEFLTVTNLPEGARIRLAAMDSYDGVRWGMSEPLVEGHGFYQVGDTISPVESAMDAESRRDFDVAISYPNGVDRWVPTVGHVEHIDLADEEVANAFYYDGNLLTAATTVDLPETLNYTMSGWVEPDWTEGQLSGLPLGNAQLPAPTGMPESIPALAADITVNASSPLERARALERYFADNGYFANGIEHPSRPGHTADRISRLVDSEQMIGDDEQYATAMALAARSLGMPARVVIGAYPETYNAGQQVLNGEDVHVWVEIQFEGAGWVPFDPTPPRDQTPQTEIPEPRAVPQPQVLQPPEPPNEPPELPSENEERDPEDPLDPPINLPWGLISLGAGILLIILIPLLGIPLYKVLRKRQRKKEADATLAVRNSWREATDFATDAGVTFQPRTTMLEQAETIESDLPAEGRAVALAHWVSAVEFSPQRGEAHHAERAWQLESELRESAGPSNWWERYRMHLSWRSLSRRKKE